MALRLISEKHGAFLYEILSQYSKHNAPCQSALPPLLISLSMQNHVTKS